MLTLGIETSCDETSVALVEDGRRIRSNTVWSQLELHREYGGVVPELAARAHLERLPLVLGRALEEGGAELASVDEVAVTRGPGLIGALLVGVGFARGLALERGLPIMGVSHLDGHLHSAYLADPGAMAPMLVLIVSGGHTELVLVGEDETYTRLGHTLDDAAGEAYDKVARLLGLPYPGGPEIDRLAQGVDPATAQRAFPLPRIAVDGLDFSFSGIKTAVRYAVEKRGDLDPETMALAAASFQSRVVEHLLGRLREALDMAAVATVAITGGVAGNSALRAAAADLMASRAARLVIPEPALCTDNAAMIAAAGHHLRMNGRPGGLEVNPSLGLH